MLHTSHSILKCRFSVHYRLPKLNGIERNGDNFIVDDQLLVGWGYIDIIITMTDKILSQHEVNVQHVELISMWDTATTVLEKFIPMSGGCTKVSRVHLHVRKVHERAWYENFNSPVIQGRLWNVTIARSCTKKYVTKTVDGRLLSFVP